MSKSGGGGGGGGGQCPPCPPSPTPLRTVKDANPLPLPDEVQDRLANSSIFSTLDLQNGYWQLPVQSNDCEKTAFCPGPGMGLYQFTRMPFGLTGAPSSFQRLMDHILREFPFVSRYIDDILTRQWNYTFIT